MQTPSTDRDSILSALRTWINQRPGLDLADYCDEARPGYDPRTQPRDPEGRRAYSAEVRRITQQRADALEMLRHVELFSVPIGADTFERAFSGRLTWDGARLEYTTGQYWPTEYRLAAAAVLRGALWACWLSNVAPDAEDKRARILKAAKDNLSAGVFRRWFKES